MRKILLIFLMLMPFRAEAALNSATNWEIRQAGADTNGGGFTLGVSSISSKTDLAVDATTNTIVTSAGYVFTAADAGRWINITAGTGFTIGYYQILSVDGSNKATLNASPAATSTTGGSFTIYKGLDYSQQNAVNPNGGSNGSSVVAVTAGTTTLTCADCTFTQDIVGNVVYLTGGTAPVTAQRRAITAYTNATTVTMDATVPASTGTTLNIGGALGSLDEVFSSRGIVASNVIWWKNDSPITSANAVSSSIAGGQLKGYNSTRGDLDQSIYSTSRPKLTFTGTSAYAITLSSNIWQLRNFIIDVNSSSGSSGLNTTSTSSFIYNVSVKNYDNIGITLGGSSTCYYCEATAGTVNATSGINVVTLGALWGSYVHDGVGIGIKGASQAVMENNVVANQSGATSDCYQISPVNNPPIIRNNTAYNCGRNGINDLNTTTPVVMLGNILVNNGAYGIAISGTVVTVPYQDGNAFYNNASGNKNNITSRNNQSTANPPYLPVNDVTLTGDPFTNAAGADFSLNNTAGAGAALRNSGVPRAWGTTTTGYPDFGAVQHNDPGATVVHPNCAF